MWAPARSMWRNEASSPLSRSSLTARCSHTGGQALDRPEIGLPEPFARSVAKPHSVTALTAGPDCEPLRCPAPIEPAQLPSPSASAVGAGDPLAAPPERAARGESDGDPSVAAARHRARRPRARQLTPQAERESELNRRCVFLLPAMLAAAAVAADGRHGRGEAAAPEHRVPKRVDADLSLHVSEHNVLAGQRPGRQRPGEPEPRRRPPRQGRRRRPLGRPAEDDHESQRRLPRPLGPAQHRHLRGPRLRRPRPRASPARRASPAASPSTGRPPPPTTAPASTAAALACGGTLQPGTLGVAHKWLPCGTRVQAALPRPLGHRAGRRPRPLRRRPRLRPDRGDQGAAALPRPRRRALEPLARPGRGG